MMSMWYDFVENINLKKGKTSRPGCQKMHMSKFQNDKPGFPKNFRIFTSNILVKLKSKTTQFMG